MVWQQKNVHYLYIPLAQLGVLVASFLLQGVPNFSLATRPTHSSLAFPHEHGFRLIYFGNSDRVHSCPHHHGPIWHHMHADVRTGTLYCNIRYSDDLVLS